MLENIDHQKSEFFSYEMVGTIVGRSGRQVYTYCKEMDLKPKRRFDGIKNKYFSRADVYQIAEMVAKIDGYTYLRESVDNKILEVLNNKDKYQQFAKDTDINDDKNEITEEIEINTSNEKNEKPSTSGSESNNRALSTMSQRELLDLLMNNSEKAGRAETEAKLYKDSLKQKEKSYLVIKIACAGLILGLAALFYFYQNITTQLSNERFSVLSKLESAQKEVTLAQEYLKAKDETVQLSREQIESFKQLINEKNEEINSLKLKLGNTLDTK